MTDDVDALLLADFADRERTVRFESVDDVDVLALLETHVRAVDVARAGRDGATIDEDGRAIVSRGSNHTAGHVLVAAGDGDVGVVVLGLENVRSDEAYKHDWCFVSTIVTWT